MLCYLNLGRKQNRNQGNIVITVPITNFMYHHIKNRQKFYLIFMIKETGNNANRLPNWTLHMIFKY